MRIAIAGASGLIGTHLCRELPPLGHTVMRLTRPTSSAPAPDTSHAIPWDPVAGGLDPAALAGCDAVVNLAGASIGSVRWTAARKREIIDSRLRATALLARTIAALPPPRPVLLSASAVGYYGDRPWSAPCAEDAPPGTGFLAEVAQAWEAQTQAAVKVGVRVVLLRLGVVLSPLGGMLPRLLPLFRTGLGGRLGHGGQALSWIAGAELAPLVHFILGQPDLHGPVNLAAPGAVTNAQFTRALAQQLHRPALAVAPAPLLRLALGEQAQELLLSGVRAIPQALVAQGYRFSYPALPAALAACLVPLSTT